MDPINYSIDVQQPFQAALQGYQVQTAIQQQQAQQAQVQQQQAAQARMQADLSGLAANKNATAADYASMITRYPQLSEPLKRASDAMSGAQQESFIQNNAPVLAALQNGRPDVADKLLRDSAAAKRASGLEDQAKQDEAFAEVAKINPDIARSSLAFRIAALPGGDKVLDGITKLGAEDRAKALAPAELAQKEADAKQAQVKAQYADQNAILDLQKKGWDITKIQEDIGIQKEANRIAAMNAATSRANSATQRDELNFKIQQARQTLDQQIREKAAKAESGAAVIDNALNTIERIKKNPSLDSVLGSMQGSKFYPNVAVGTLTPGMNGQEQADAIALIETLSSQVFLSQVPALKGTGNLSEREGDKLEKSLQSLSRKQSEAQFRANLDEAERLMKKARENLSNSTGVPLPPPDTPAAPGARPPLSSFFKP